MADGFLGRWSQRKQAVREGKPLAEPEVKPAAAPSTGTAAAAPSLAEGGDPTGQAAHADRTNDPEHATKPALTLQDTEALTGDSDFRPFVGREVAPDVRNAAVKKLFADPRYNVMDRLDIYIDDYSQPDPLPLAMLQQMVSAQFLNLVETPETPVSAVSPQAPQSSQAPPETEVALTPPAATEPLSVSPNVPNP